MPRSWTAYDPPLTAVGQLNKTAPAAGEEIDLVAEGALREIEPGSDVFERSDMLLFQNLSDTIPVRIYFTEDLLNGGFWTLHPKAISGFRLDQRTFAVRGDGGSASLEVMVMKRL